MNPANSKLFLFDDSIANDQLLKTYIGCLIKYNTLEWYLNYEQRFIDYTSINYSIDENSSQEELDYYFRYLKACHLGIEYIEHALKLLLMLEGMSNKQIKSISNDHDLEKTFDALTDINTKDRISRSINPFGKEYIRRYVLRNQPASMILSSGDDINSGKTFSYFKAVLRVLKDSFVDLRYPEVSDKYGYYDFAVILAICDEIARVIYNKIEKFRIFKDGQFISEFYHGKMLRTKYIADSKEVDLSKPLTEFEMNKMKSSNKAKFDSLKWFMYGMEEFYYRRDLFYWPDLLGIIANTPLTRERINKKSDDKDVYENYLYYQACHLTSDFIEHSLKLLLIKSGYTYAQIKDEFGHDFEKMFNALDSSIQERLKGIVSYFDESYLRNALNKNPDFRDVLKKSSRSNEDFLKELNLLLKEERTIEEEAYLEKQIEKGRIEYQHNLQYFDGILSQIADAFKFTRYPDFYNYNLEYKYCLRFLLAFAEELRIILEKELGITYTPSSSEEQLVDKGYLWYSYPTRPKDDGGGVKKRQ